MKALSKDNPFFKHSIDKLCIICNCKLKNASTSYSIFDKLAKTKLQMKVCEALESISNFKEINFQNGPERICAYCYKNTSSAIRFREMCDKSASLFKSFLQHKEEMKNLAKNEIIDTKTYVEIAISTESTCAELSTKSEIINDDMKPVIDMDAFPELTTITTPETLHNIDEATMFEQDEIKSGEKDEMQRGEKDDIQRAEKDVIQREEKDEIQIGDNGVLKVKCKVCNTFYRKDYMSVHKRVHTGETPYSCGICGKRFKDPSSFRVHKPIHQNKQEFLCSVCGKSFKFSESLKRHIRRHSDERPYECEVCGKKFRETKTLREHGSVHSDERPFACEVCGKCFPAKKHLRQHMISHAEVKRHECHLCGNRFTQAHSLRTHLSKHCKGSS